MLRRLCGVLPSVLFACVHADRAPLAKPTRETLPGGAISVMSSGPTAWTDTNGWRLEETSRIRGGDSGARELIRPGDAVLDAAGRLYIADTDPDIIKVFSARGDLTRTIGRQGDGPGEYRSVRLGIAGANLIVHDPRLGRTSVFDTSGTFVRTWRTVCCDFSSISVDQQGRIAIRVHGGPTHSQDGFVRFASDGRLIDTLWAPIDGEPKYIEFSGKGSSARMTLRDAPAQLSVIIPDGRLVHGWTGAYRLIVSRTGRDTIQIFGRSAAPVEIPAAVRRARYDEMAANLKRSWGEEAAARAFSPGDIPRYAAAVGYLEGDGAGNRWVSRYTGDSLHQTYDVFDSTGAFLGPVRAPWGRGYGAAYWGTNEMVVTGTNSDGQPEVIRYRIERTQHP